LTGIRVAAVQFAIGSDVDANLAACVRMVNAAAARGAHLIVLPAYCNHPVEYTDRAHAERVACRLGDGFLETLSALAAEHEVYLKLHVTLAVEERLVAANLLYSPDGTLLARADTTALSAPERQWLDPVPGPGLVANTLIGRFGLVTGSDAARAGVPRALAVAGAEVLLVSMDAVSTDDTRLHVPVRAAENKVWIVAANVIGSRPGASALGVPEDWLSGVGESAAFGPDGAPVARAPRRAETVVIADIEPGWADDKTRPDGGDIFLSRRPRLYAAGRPPGARPPAAASTRVAVMRPDGHGMSAIEDAGRRVRAAAEDGVELIVLPELFHYADGRADGSFLDGIAVDVIAQSLDGTACHVVTTLPDDAAHVGVLISARGVSGRQVQMHPCARHVGWQAALGDRLVPMDLSWGRLVIMVGDDALYPEMFDLAARLGADAVAVPCVPAERWELTLGLPARTAECGLNIVASAHPGPGGGGVILVPVADPVLHADRVGGFDGTLAEPAVARVPAGVPVVTGVIHPERARRRLPESAVAAGSHLPL
jgi:predicted amidohydrolase